ncbi:MAG: TIGR04086 family membrane protein [Oscillospiraceae bacterium]|nr:TIGR04086 family membrane protein [Oscillospiraceae bacterium]
MAKVKTNSSDGIKLLKSALIGALIGTAILVVLSLASALVISSVDVPHRMVGTIAVILTAISAFFGGFAAGKINLKNALLVGLVCAAIEILIFVVSSLLTPDSLFSASQILKALLILFCTLIGAVIGVNFTKKY